MCSNLYCLFSKEIYVTSDKFFNFSEKISLLLNILNIFKVFLLSISL